jgi:hypothetical protein
MGNGFFLFTTLSRSALGPTQPPIQRVLGALFPGVRGLELDACHTLPSSAEVRNELSYTFTSSCVFMAWYLVKVRELCLIIIIIIIIYKSHASIT